MSVALLLTNNLDNSKQKMSNLLSPAPPPYSWSLLGKLEGPAPPPSSKISWSFDLAWNPGIKHEVTSLLFPVAIFHSGLVWCRSVLFCLGHCRIHSLVSFFRLGLFFGLRVFRDSVFSNLQSCFDILSSFFGFVLRAFYLQWFCWYQLFKGLIFLNFLGAFLWVFFYRAFLSGFDLSSTSYIGLLCLLRMHAINSCVGDAW